MLVRLENKTGWIDIERPVIAKIVKESVMGHMEVYAIVNSRGQISPLLKKLSFDRNADFIKITKNKGDKIEIELYLLLYFGVPISFITKKLMEAIRADLKKYMDMDPDTILIHVVGLKTKKSIVERDILAEG